MLRNAAYIAAATVVMVRFDGATVERWMHRDSLTVVPSDFYPINAERA